MCATAPPGLQLVTATTESQSDQIAAATAIEHRSTGVDWHVTAYAICVNR